MKLTLGIHLSPTDRAYVLSTYVHRFTGQHKPSWALKPWKDGLPYPLQFADDADWLVHTEFHTTKAGRLDRRSNHCFSSPTWPNNPELRKQAA